VELKHEKDAVLKALEIFQSNQSGIETTFTHSRNNNFDTSNRTKVELKQLLQTFAFKVISLPIEPKWN